jgi:very-short-patch-repair endonuclease
VGGGAGLRRRRGAEPRDRRRDLRTRGAGRRPRPRHGPAPPSGIDAPWRAVGARLTTAARIRAALCGRRRLRWRRHLLAALDDVGAGCHSILELLYLRRVERAHRLPVGLRQSHRGHWYDDVAYPDYGVCVELDGRTAHQRETAFRDHRRDNAATLVGTRVPRYGYSDVATRPCLVALEVATVLAQAGWRRAPVRCGADCTLDVGREKSANTAANTALSLPTSSGELR